MKNTYTIKKYRFMRTLKGTTHFAEVSAYGLQHAIIKAKEEVETCSCDEVKILSWRTGKTLRIIR